MKTCSSDSQLEGAPGAVFARRMKVLGPEIIHSYLSGLETKTVTSLGRHGSFFIIQKFS